MPESTVTRCDSCSRCSGPMPLLARADARYCSPACRQAAYRERRASQTGGLPREMTRRSRWVRYTARKVPLTTHGRPASSTDPSTWSDFPRAFRSKVGAGVGFVLSRGDGIVCLDLDHVIGADGSLVPWAEQLLAQLPSTYIEVSRSGTGLHVFGWGRLPGTGRRWTYKDGTGLEVYADGRYIAMTANRWRGAPAALAELSEVLDTLM